VYKCICNSIKEGELHKYHLIGTGCGNCIMAGGIYNETYFKNYPEEKEVDGILYGIVLVNQVTWERETIKVGIAKGRTFKDAVKRGRGFTNYDIRIQRLWQGNLYDCWRFEQKLHKMYQKDRHKTEHKFGGHTECFSMKSKILESFPKKNDIFRD